MSTVSRSTVTFRESFQLVHVNETFRGELDGEKAENNTEQNQQ